LANSSSHGLDADRKSTELAEPAAATVGPGSTVFASHAYDLSYPPDFDKHYWNRARQAIVKRTLVRLLAGWERDPNRLVLDVGCGRGAAVLALERAGIPSRGVELGEPQILDGASQLVDTGVAACDLPPAVRDRTDVILLLDVLEHLPDPAGFLRELRTAFPVLQWVVATVPARMELWSNYDEFFGHYLRYSRNDMQALAADSSFVPVEMRYFFQSLWLPAWVAARLGGRAVSIASPSRWATPLHVVLAAWLRAESSLSILHAVPGTSLLAVLAAPNPDPLDSRDTHSSEHVLRGSTCPS
jgi:SAM-dependent methyltransferase